MALQEKTPLVLSSIGWVQPLGGRSTKEWRRDFGRPSLKLGKRNGHCNSGESKGLAESFQGICRRPLEAKGEASGALRARYVALPRVRHAR